MSNTHKNAFEIRTEILGMAKSFVEGEYNAKFAGWEYTQKLDKSSNQITTTVNIPEYPNVEEIMDVARSMYSFVEGFPKALYKDYSTTSDTKTDTKKD